MLPQRGKDLYATAEISFKESYTGTQRTFNLQSKVVCTLCQGTRRSRLQKCPECDGTRFISVKRRVVLNIPAGVDTGVNVRVTAEGEPGVFGGTPGDFYVNITVIPDTAFGRNGDDLYVYAKIERSIAIFGGEVPVKMPDGSTYVVKAPRGLSDGVLIRTANAGMPIPHAGKKGNLYVTVKIVPDSIIPISAPKKTKVPTNKSAMPRKKREVKSNSLVPLPSPQAAPSSVKTRINTILGNYRILSLLGAGGFADVFLAQHTYLQTQAAIKILRERVKPQEVQEFLQEAQIVASLKHPHIVRVLDFGMEPDTTIPYLVMDYVPGGTLQDLHSEGEQLPHDAIVSYVKQIAAALDYAHTQKVIHRDVKPANMLIEANHILLSDFGIAVAAHSTQSLVTQNAIGTVTYMAPEQIRKKPRPASDQYALAVIVYEWLCGTPPFTGDPIEIAMSHISDPPPSLCAKLPTITVEIEQVVFRALNKDPEQRFPTVQAFADTLEQTCKKG